MSITSTWDNLPTVITAPGEYITRDGKRATVHEIVKFSSFPAKGFVWKMFRGNLRPRDYTTWHPSGRTLPLRKSKRDIVGTWPA